MGLNDLVNFGKGTEFKLVTRFANLKLVHKADGEIIRLMVKHALDAQQLEDVVVKQLKP